MYLGPIDDPIADDIDNAHLEFYPVVQELFPPSESPHEETIISPRYDFRPSRQRTYAHHLDHQMDDPAHSKTYMPPTQLLQQVITAYIMTQLSRFWYQTVWQTSSGRHPQGIL
jgi:hypothetical protein